jgi:hypothetical protein
VLSNEVICVVLDSEKIDSHIRSKKIERWLIVEVCVACFDGYRIDQ